MNLKQEPPPLPHPAPAAGNLLYVASAFPSHPVSAYKQIFPLARQPSKGIVDTN